MYAPSALIAVWFFTTLTHMFCINTIIVSVAEVYLMNFNFTDPLCKRTRVLEYNGMLATVSLLLSVAAGVVASFTIDPDRDEWEDQLVYRPAWLRTSCIIISFIFLGWSIFSLIKALSIEKSSAIVTGARCTYHLDHESGRATATLPR